MIFDLKALSFAAAAVFAMALVMASSATAQQGFLTSDGPVTLEGVELGVPGSNTFTAFGLTVSCPGSGGTGHKIEATPHELIPNGATTITITPEIVNCVIAGLGWPLTTDFNGCDYVTHIGETTGGEHTYGGSLDIDCPSGQQILWTMWTAGQSHASAPFCVFHVPEAGNQGLAGPHIKDTTNGHLEINGTLEGIDITRTKSASHPLLCPESTTTAGKADLDGTISGVDEVGDPTAIGLSHQ
jgi:hypothetical protein